MMEVFEGIRTLLAVRRYLERPVPEAVVRKILEAGRLTGSAMNLQPWHFIVVRERETLKRLGALARSGPYIAQAPLAIAVAVDKSGYAVSDGSRAIHSMLLTAWSEGVGSNWVGFSNLEKVNALLGIPATLDVLAILPSVIPPTRSGEARRTASHWRPWRTASATASHSTSHWIASPARASSHWWAAASARRKWKPARVARSWSTSVSPMW